MPGLPRRAPPAAGQAQALRPLFVMAVFPFSLYCKAARTSFSSTGETARRAPPASAYARSKVARRSGLPTTPPTVDFGADPNLAQLHRLGVTPPDAAAGISVLGQSHGLMAMPPAF